MSLPGKILYHGWHRPYGALRDLAADGGPWQRRRTAAGRREMEATARHLPFLPDLAGPPLSVHLLTGARFWDQTAFCLWTLSRQSRRPLAPVIYDDGSLASEHEEALLHVFPDIRFVSVGETTTKLDALLPVTRFPALRERWLNYPNLRKLIDPHLGSRGWKLVLDSDLLFFHPPGLLLEWMDQPTRPLHAVDCTTSYGYSPGLMQELTGHPVAPLVNVGIIGLDSGELDWERLEFWTNTLIQRERPHYYLEQALVAMWLAGRDCTIAPARDYVTMPRPPESLACRAVMHHYVAHSKRWYFQHNWRRVLQP